MNIRHLQTDPDWTPDVRTRWLLGLCGVLLIAAIVVWWPGCRQYPRVSSVESLKLMKLLYSACNTRDTARLERVERGVAQAERAGKITETEVQAFQRVIAMARAGEWKDAEKASFRFAEDQVR